MPVEIYSTETDAGWVSAIRKVGDNEFELVGRITVGGAPRGPLAPTRDGRGYVANSGEGTVSEIDLGARRETARIKVGDEPQDVVVVPGDRYALVSNSGSGCVSVVDLDAGMEVGRFGVGTAPRHMAVTADGRWAYVAVWGSRYVARVDLCPLWNEAGGASDRVREVARLPAGDSGQPNSVALHGDGRQAYVAKMGGPCISVLDVEAAALVAEIPIGGRGGRSVAITRDSRYAFATVEHRSAVVAIDLTSRRIVRRIPVGACPRGVAVDPFELTVYSCGFSRLAHHSRASSSPKALTVVNLGLGPDLDAETQPAYAEVPLAASPSSVAVVDLDASRNG